MKILRNGVIGKSPVGRLFSCPACLCEWKSEPGDTFLNDSESDLFRLSCPYCHYVINVSRRGIMSEAGITGATDKSGLPRGKNLEAQRMLEESSPSGVAKWMDDNTGDAMKAALYGGEPE